MELWSPEHIRTLLPALVVMLVISVLLRLWLGKKDLKIRMIPLQVIAVILLLMEAGKQSVSWDRGYDLYHIPLHFCSTVMFALPFMAFYNGKYAQRIRTIATALCGATFWLTAIYPCLIYGAGSIQAYTTDFMSFHTVTFHNLVMLAFMIIVALDLHQPEKKGEFPTLIIYLTGFCIVAAIVSQLLQTNYAGFYHCNVPPIEDFRQMLITKINYPVAQCVYVAGLTVVHYGFVCGFYAIYKLLHLLCAIKQPVNV